jgi:hypothetical protein
VEEERENTFILLTKIMIKKLLISYQNIASRDLILILTFLIIISCHQEKQEKIITIEIENEINNDIKKYGLNGKIKSIKSERLDIIETFNGFKESNKTKNWGEWRSRTRNQYYTYNIYGLKRLKNYYLQESFWTFNEFGNIISIEKFDNKRLESRSIYEYDTNNVLLQESWYDKTEVLKYRTIFTYKENGDIESKTLQYPYKTFEAQSIQRFDTNNNITELIVDKAGREKEYQNFKYDSLNNIIECNLFTSAGSLYTKTKKKYNHHNDVIERKIFENTKFSILKSHTTFQYKYDKNENWIEQIWCKNGGISHMLIKRTIEYY